LEALVAIEGECYHEPGGAVAGSGLEASPTTNPAGSGAYTHSILRHTLSLAAHAKSDGQSHKPDNSYSQAFTIVSVVI
jgi:hypothetical protein